MMKYKNFFSETPQNYVGFFKCFGFIIFLSHQSKNFLKLKIESFFNLDFNKSKIDIAIPIIKHNPFNFILKSLVQLNINKIFPYFSEYSISKKFSKSKIEKWNNILIESSKQSRNNYINYIDNIYNFHSIARLEYPLKLCFDNLSDFPINKIENIGKNSRILLLIGPEGGFSHFETDLLKENNFTFVKLNSNILRSEIAVISTVTIIKFLIGEL